MAKLWLNFVLSSNYLIEPKISSPYCKIRVNTKLDDQLTILLRVMVHDFVLTVRCSFRSGAHTIRCRSHSGELGCWTQTILLSRQLRVRVTLMWRARSESSPSRIALYLVGPSRGCCTRDDGISLQDEYSYSLIMKSRE